MKSCLSTIFLACLFSSVAFGQASPGPVPASTLVESLVSKNINNLRMCDQFPGANAGAKIAACIADLPSGGGIADARGLVGMQNIESSIPVGRKDSVTLLLGHATFSGNVNPFFQVATGLQVIGSGRSATILKQTATSSVIFNVAAQGPLHLRDLTIASSTSQAAGAAVILDGLLGGTNNTSYFENVSFVNQWVGIDFKTTDAWKVFGCQFVGTAFRGIRVNNTSNADQGDNLIIGNIFSSNTAMEGTVAIEEIAGGIGKIVDNKFFQHGIGFLMNWAPFSGIDGGQLMISNNRFEPQTTAGLQFQRTGTSGTFGGVSILGNYFRSDSSFVETHIKFVANAAAWLSNVIISDNNMNVSTSSTAIDFGGRTGDAAAIYSNTIYGSGRSAGIIVGRNYGEMQFGLNSVLVGSGGAYTVASGTRGNYYPVDNQSFGVPPGLPLTERVTLGNADYIASRNASGNAVHKLIGENTSDQVVLAGSGQDIALGGRIVATAGKPSATFADRANALKITHPTAGLTLANGADTAWLVENNGNLRAPVSLTVGPATSVKTTQINYHSPILTPRAVSPNTTTEQTFGIPGLSTEDTVIVNGPGPTPGTGIVGARVSAANTLALTFINATSADLVPTSGIYKIYAYRN